MTPPAEPKIQRRQQLSRRSLLLLIALLLVGLWGIISSVVNKVRLMMHEGPIDEYVPASYTFSGVLHSMHPVLPLLSGFIGLVLFIWAIVMYFSRKAA